MSGSVAAPCAGAAIPSWGGTGHWGKAACLVGPDEVRDISVPEGPWLEVADGSGEEVLGAGMDGPGRLGVNLSRGPDRDRAMLGRGWLSRATGGCQVQRSFKGKHWRQGVDCCRCDGCLNKGTGAGVRCRGDKDSSAGC